jgi:hypothetical protein
MGSPTKPLRNRPVFAPEKRADLAVASVAALAGSVPPSWAAWMAVETALYTSGV